MVGSFALVRRNSARLACTGGIELLANSSRGEATSLLLLGWIIGRCEPLVHLRVVPLSLFVFPLQDGRLSVVL